MDFKQEKLIQIILYVLNNTKGVDFYHLFKILYFAELKHLSKWGSSMLPDKFCALEYGPVPTLLYDLVKNNMKSHEIQSEFDKAVRFAGNDAPNIMLANMDANKDYLSKSEIEALDESIKENKNLTFNELKTKSHDAAWQKAFQCGGNHIISLLDMAKVANADENTLAYIQEQMDLEEVLS